MSHSGAAAPKRALRTMALADSDFDVKPKIEMSDLTVFGVVGLRGNAAGTLCLLLPLITAVARLPNSIHTPVRPETVTG